MIIGKESECSRWFDDGELSNDGSVDDMLSSSKLVAVNEFGDSTDDFFFFLYPPPP